MLELAIVAAVLVAYAFLSKKLEYWVSGPLIFMTVGILISEPFLGWFRLELGSGLVQLLLKGSLALVLFSEAAALGAKRVHETGLPARLLLIAMPLVMVLGLGAALVLFDVLSIWEALVVAALLAPTDASLGRPVVTNERIPGRIRDALVIEGGLNDGLAVPFAVFAAAVAEASAAESGAPALLELLAKEIGFAVIAGIVVGFVAAKAAAAATSRDWATGHAIRYSIIGVAIIAFAVAEAFHGSGFIAAWVGGLVYGLTSAKTSEKYLDFSEREGDLLVLLSFLIFGGLIAGPFLPDVTWQMVVYAVLSLALIRPIAVALSALGSGESRPTVAFLGWFGPRGLPSLVLAVILISEGFELAEGRLVLGIVVVTVIASVYLHGITAGPLSERYVSLENDPTADK